MAGCAQRLKGVRQFIQRDDIRDHWGDINPSLPQHRHAGIKIVKRVGNGKLDLQLLHQPKERHDGIGLLLDSRHVVPRQEKAVIALVTMAIVVLLAATKTLPIGLAALGGVLVLLATRSLSWQDVGNSLSTKVIMLVAASLALGSALSTTGGTAFLAGPAGASSPTRVERCRVLSCSATMERLRVRAASSTRRSSCSSPPAAGAGG